ncbi:hypothetical protein ACF08W_29330 [Streptomyces sp. NPDC015144]|uniref:hypothetical protein n=1 Tax=Streptomyces sp. NPDC015144 TaxID=3364944 RepID=UPI0036FB4776
MTTPLLDNLAALDDHDLLDLRAKAQDLLRERNGAALAGVVLNVLRDVLAETGDTRTPLRVAFVTTEWDNGHFWYPEAARVTFFDGSTEEIETVDLSGADDELTDHASYQPEPLNGFSQLVITFEPPAVVVS